MIQSVSKLATRTLLKAGRPAASTVSSKPRTMATKSGEWGDNELGQQTKSVHGGVNPDPTTGAILTPIYYSTTFIQESVEKYLEKGYSYSRSGNPTVRALEERIAGLENGYGATCVSTGMAATTTVICGTMNAGDHCVISDCSYGGTNRICREHFAVNMGMEFDFVDFRDPEIVRAAIKPNTKLIFSETPTNPTLNLVDIEAVSAIAKEHGIVHCVDATFATPVICRPLDHGADLTLQSTTKFYDGHNMTVGGAVIAKTKELDDRMHMVQNMHGNIMSPMNAFLQMQTTKTMPLRVRQQSNTAMKIATFLESHPKVTKVVYPGLASHPQKELADKYHRDNLHGAMLWFDVKGGDVSAIKLMDTCQRPWSLCENLGATESIITGKYSSEGAAREWSTVVNISIKPPSFKPVSLSLSRFSLFKTPKQVFFNPIHILTLLPHFSLIIIINLLFSF